MSMLSETNRLTMAPSSNVRRTGNDSWVHLLPCKTPVVVTGQIPDRARRVLEERAGRAVIRYEGGVPMSQGPVILVVGAGGESFESMAHLDFVAIVMHGPERSDGFDHEWLRFEDPTESTTMRRMRRAATLLTARAATAVGLNAPASTRRHASDVGFLSVPQSLTREITGAGVAIARDDWSLPDWILDLADRHGLELDGTSWRFGPHRGFRSQKIVFGASTTAGDAVIVKQTQDPSFNARLGAEHDALGSVADFGELETLSTAQPLFAGEWCGMLAIGQTAIRGRPFRTVAEPSPDHWVSRAGFDAIIDLSSLSSRHAPALEVEEAMGGLLERFLNIFEPPPAAVARLRGCVERLSSAGLPTVFMHGDFGVWNMLVTPDRRVGVLDWENADPEGVPLWDLFVYVRTLGVLNDDLTGRRYGSSRFARHFFEPSPFRDMFMAWVREYADAVELPMSCVDDLFVMCWVQQAVREAASLANPKWMDARGTQYVARALETGVTSP